MRPLEGRAAKPLAEKIALVTGGTGGIGGAIAVALADAGCQVTATGCTQEEIDRFDSQDRNIVRRVLDVTNADQIAERIAEFSRLDILVNAAGIILRDDREHQSAKISPAWWM